MFHVHLKFLYAVALLLECCFRILLVDPLTVPLHHVDCMFAVLCSSESDAVRSCALIILFV